MSSSHRGLFILAVFLGGITICGKDAMAVAGEPIPGVDISLEQIPGGIVAKAPKVLVNFVPAFQPCTTPGLTHAAPLAFPACQTQFHSGEGSFGPKGIGQFTGVVKLNSLKQATDVQFVGKFVDVRLGTQGTGTAFTGNMSLVWLMRLTDTNCPGNPVSTCTMEDIPFPVGIPCVAGKCLLKTTANGVIPGFVVPGTHAVLEMSGMAVSIGTGPLGVQGLLLP